MRFVNGLLQPTSVSKKSLKGLVMIDYRIECEECDNTSYAATFEKPYYCPCCGRRAEIELVDEAEELNFD